MSVVKHRDQANKNKDSKNVMNPKKHWCHKCTSTTHDTTFCWKSVGAGKPAHIAPNGVASKTAQQNLLNPKIEAHKKIFAF